MATSSSSVQNFPQDATNVWVLVFHRDIRNSRLARFLSITIDLDLANILQYPKLIKYSFTLV